MEKLSTGAKPIDQLLNGGYEQGVITTLFGEAGSGKSNLCILAALTAAKQAKKVIFIDTEGSFSVERAKQLEPHYEDVMKNILFLNPTSFDEQKDIFKQISSAADIKRIGLIVVDSMVMLYRLAKADENIAETNLELANQLRTLSEIARKKSIPILVTNQVYSDFKTNDLKIVSGDIIKYWSKCIVKLEKLDSSSYKASIFKHRSLAASNSICFEIKDQGLIEVKDPKKGFRLF